MSIYLVHLPPEGKSVVKTAIRTSFLREGFRWAAFAFGPLWLLWNRLWLELFFFIVATGLLFLGEQFWGLSSWAATAVSLLIQLFLGFEGTAMLEHKLERGNFRFADVVAGRARDEIERRFFARWKRA